MIVFGGYDGAKSLNDLQAYDSGILSSTSALFSSLVSPFGLTHLCAVTGDWKELVGRGKAPSPRFGHSAVVYQQDKMYIFGGYDGVDRNDLYCFDFGKRTLSLCGHHRVLCGLTRLPCTYRIDAVECGPGKAGQPAAAPPVPQRGRIRGRDVRVWWKERDQALP
jgi:hypothetical protein